MKTIPSPLSLLATAALALGQAGLAQTKLLDVLNQLVEQGNTVVVIEHNLDVIKCADHLIDLGPEGGSGGGEVVATGTPEELASNHNSVTGQFLTNLVNSPIGGAARDEPS